MDETEPQHTYTHIHIQTHYHALLTIPKNKRKENLNQE